MAQQFKVFTPQSKPQLNIQRQQMANEIQAYQNQLSVVNEEKKTRKNVLSRYIGTTIDVTENVSYGLLKGVEGIADLGMGIAGTVGGWLGADDFEEAMQNAIEYDVAGAVNPYLSKLINTIGTGAELLGVADKDDSYVNELSDKWQGRVRGGAQAIGQMLPSILIGGGIGGTAGKVASTVTFGAGAGGTSTEKALSEGAELDQATAYGILSGALEAGIEMASGGIGGTGSGYLSKLFPNVAKKLSANMGVRIASTMLGEGIEEAVAEYLNPYLERMTYNPDAEKATTEAMYESFVMGALIGGIMGGGSAIAQAQQSKIQNAIDSYNNGTLTEAEAKTLNKELGVILDQVTEQQQQEQTEIQTETQEQVNTQEITESAENALKQGENANIESVVENATIEQEVEPIQTEQQAEVEVKAEEVIQQEQQQEEVEVMALVKNEQGEYVVEDVTVEQGLDNGMELVKINDGKYDSLIENGVIPLQTPDNSNKVLATIMTKNGPKAKVLKTSNQLKSEGKLDYTKNNVVENSLTQETTQETKISPQQASTGGGNVIPPYTSASNGTSNLPMNPLQMPDTSNKVLAVETKTKKTWRDRWFGFKRMFTDSMANVEDFLMRKGIERNKAQTIIHTAKLGNSIAGSWMSNGITITTFDANGKITGVKKMSKSFIEVFKFLEGKDENYKQEFFDYLLHRHNRSRMDLQFNVELTANQKMIFDDALQNGEISQNLYDMLTNPDQPIKPSQIRDELIKAQSIVSEDTLNTLVNILGDQKPVFDIHTTKEMSELKVAEYDKKFPEFKTHAQSVYDYNNALLQMQVEKGIITQEFKDQLNDTYPDYVPTHREQKQQSNKGITKVGVQSGIKTASGSNLVIKPIDKQIFIQTQIVARSIAVNPLLQQLGNNADGVEVKTSNKRIDDVSKIPDVDTKNSFTYFEKGIDKNGNEVIKQKTIHVTNDIAQGINSISSINMDADLRSFSNAIRRGNSLFKRLTTALNPYFSFWRNPIRDIQNALLYTKFDNKTFARNYAKAMKIMLYEKNNVEWQTYLANGGTMSSFYTFDQTIQNQAGKKQGKVSKGMEKLELAGQIIEQGPRFAEYLSSREAGLSVEESILNSAEVTVNFLRSGTVVKYANSTFMPFLNPKMQGALKFTRMFTEGNSRKAMVTLGVRLSVLGIACSIFNNFMYGDDDDYKDLSSQVKNGNYLFKIGNNWFRIPKAEVIAGISATYNRTKDAIKGEDNAFDGYGDEMLQAFSPVENARTIFSPLVDYKTNTTWYGGQIESQRFMNVRPKDRYDETTSKIAITIGQALNKSPKKIHYVLDQYTGIFGDVILPATSQKGYESPGKKTITVDTTKNSKFGKNFYSLIEKLTYDKTDGDLKASAKLRYLNKVKASVSELYNEQRKITISDLPKDEKEMRIRTLQILINNSQKIALENVKKLDTNLNYFMLTDDTFEEDYREAKRLTFGAEVALEYYNKRVYEKASALNLADINFDLFYDTYFDTKEFESEYNEKGRAISGSKKTLIKAYVDSLPLTQVQKYMLFGALGYKSTKGEEAVLKYIKMLNISEDEKRKVLVACNYD